MLLSICLATFISFSHCAPVYNSSGSVQSLAWNMPYINYKPSGVLLESDAVYDYLDSLAVFIQLANCNTDEFQQVYKNCYFFPANLSSSECGSVELVRFLRPRARDSILDIEKIPFLRTSSQAGIFLDHNAKRIVIAIRSDVNMIDHLPFMADDKAVYSPLIYNSKFWKSVFVNSTIISALGKQTAEQFYDSKKNKAKLRTKTSWGKPIFKVHAGFQDLSNRYFEDLFAEVVLLTKQYKNYHLVLTGHSVGGAVASMLSLTLLDIGFNNTLVTFNSPKPWSQKLADHYDSISFTKRLHSRVILREQDALVDTERGHLRVWNSHDGFTGFPANTVIDGIGMFNGYKHSGLSIVTPQRKLVVNHEHPTFYLESEWRVSSILRNSRVDIGITASFEPHNFILRDLLACTKLHK
ncbi:hypothetical protein FOA43_003385 [Brettanomyces nanus]|uniref:triacylglycerol lipase n=1 Tax=Eeniella nana TaxID=13502 RepID=A0A875S8J4_EENNA|nr:uncharacterized protein FOA43_003385 [Brettanomyces nanus]QPG75999.1 hypothetical protein FOA43_003385 [Brettanomyces nanus]